MRLTADRITEMQNALEQRMMIGGASPGPINKATEVRVADNDFPAMIVEASNRLYEQVDVQTFGAISYTYYAYTELPHCFTLQVGDFRSEGIV